MAVVLNTTVKHLLISIFFDNEAAVGVAKFKRFINDKLDGEVIVEFTGQELGPLLFAPPVPGKTRFDDVTDAVYAAAIAKGAMTGEVV